MKNRIIRWAALFTCVSSLWTPAAFGAVDRDRAVYIGGTMTRAAEGLEPNVEGRIDIQSATELVFDAGRKGAVSVPYATVASVTFGRIAPFGRLPPKVGLVFPRDFFSKDHFVLTIAFRDRSGAEQTIVLWPGGDLVRPTLAALEERSGKTIAFTDALGCAQYRTRDECGYASAGALCEATRVFVDTAGDASVREAIVSEIQKAGLQVQIVDGADDAEVILVYRASRNPFMAVNVGIGAVHVRQDRVRLVSEFVESSGRSEKSLAERFARAFVAAHRLDNQPLGQRTSRDPAE